MPKRSLGADTETPDPGVGVLESVTLSQLRPRQDPVSQDRAAGAEPPPVTSAWRVQQDVQALFLRIAQDYAARNGYPEYVDDPFLFVEEINAIAGDQTVVAGTIQRCTSTLGHVVKMIYRQKKAQVLRVQGKSKFLKDPTQVCDFLRMILIAIGCENVSRILYGLKMTPLTMALWFSVVWEKMVEEGVLQERELNLQTPGLRVQIQTGCEYSHTLVVYNYLIDHCWHLYMGIPSVAVLSYVILTRWRDVNHSCKLMSQRIPKPETFVLEPHISNYRSFRETIKLFHIESAAGLQDEPGDPFFENTSAEVSPPLTSIP